MITGSTGSGKTTTAVALLKDKLLHHKNHGVLHLVTIESPIEYEFLVKPTEGIVEQREVGIDTPSYPAATRDVVRINPNIIFVGEVRDPCYSRKLLADGYYRALSSDNLSCFKCSGSYSPLPFYASFTGRCIHVQFFTYSCN